jgi:uncharacterized protein YgbK (DUF1537 family)
MVVRPELPREQSQITSSKVAQTLGRSAASLVRRLQMNAVVMVGGDTAFETFQALGIHDASVAGEIMPGIATGEIRVSGRSVTFITKAGGFGEANALVEILQHLKNQ